MSATSSKAGPSTWITHERPPKSTYYSFPKFLRWNSPEMDTMPQQNKKARASASNKKTINNPAPGPAIKKTRTSQANMNKPLPDYKIRSESSSDNQGGYRFAFKFTHLCHVTSWSDDEKKGIKGILNDLGFRGGMKAIDKTRVKHRLSWWAIDTGTAEVRLEDLSGKPVDGQDWTEMNKENMKSAARSLLEKFPVKFWDETEADSIADSFGNSPVFQPESHYGNYKFKIPLKELFKSYESSFCKDVKEEPKSVCRVGGTLYYPDWEIMHAVIVHPNRDDENNKLFADFERLKIGDYDSNDDSIVSVLNDRSSGIWRPDSTSADSSDSNDSRVWNSVGFAFYMPNDKQKMEFDKGLFSFFSICKAKTPFWGNYTSIDSPENAKSKLSDWAKTKDPNIYKALSDSFKK